MLRKRLFSLITCCLIATNAFAQTDAASVKLLSGIYAKAMEEVHQLKAQLEEAKLANDTALQARQTLSDVKDEYEFVTNFNPDAELQNIIGEFDDLTNINELVKAKSFDERWSLAYGEIDKRFKASDKNSKDSMAAANAKHALEELKAMEALRNTYVNEAINLDVNATDKDLQRRIASASAMTASLALDQKIGALENKIQGIQRIMSGLEWDSEFENYLKSSEKKSMAEGLVTRFLVNVINPDAIYEGMFKLTALAGFVPWIVVVIIVIRNVQESSATLVGKAAFSSAILSVNRMTIFYALYSVVGLGLFGFILMFTAMFSSFGSEDLINQQLLELRSTFNQPSSIDKSLLESTIENLIDTSNIFSAGFLFIIYQAVSVIYVAVSQFIEVLFAVFVSVAYAWGFFAIGTMALKEPLNMISGWLKSVAGLAVWAILVPFLLGILLLMSTAARVWLQGAYSDFGFGSSSFVMWQGFAIIMLIFMLTLKILAISLSAKLVSNQAMQGEFAKAATVVASIGGLKAADMAGENTKNYTSSMLPNVKDGNRFRDGVGQKINDFFGAPARDAAKMASHGVSDIARRLTGWESAPRQSSGASDGSNTTDSRQSSATNGQDNWTSNQARDAAQAQGQGEAQPGATGGPENWAANS